MKLNNIKAVFRGSSGDSFFLIFIRVVTLVLGLLMTRILSGRFSLQDYGTYSQVMLISSTVSSFTILGLMDGINFFFCKETDDKKRNDYVSTIFFVQYVASTIAALTVIACTIPISRYFDNPNLKGLLIFAAVLPVLHNSISLLQIMFIAIGKAKIIAFRNLIVSVLKLLFITIACYVFDSIVVLLLFQVILEITQVAYFVFTLRKNNYTINIFRFDKTLIKEILLYCIPMAMFSVIKSINRDSDKYIISFFTDTETLAIYTNASKLLPFDIVMISFCTVLLPYITRYISQKKYNQAQSLYIAFLELSYKITTILAMGAVCVAPELFTFLYTEKYLANGFGVTVFIIYIIVDIFSVLNLTMVLSAAGKTKTIMFVSLGTLSANILLNIGLFFAFCEIGPAVATLVVTLIQGFIIFSLTSKELKTKPYKMLSWKNFFIFLIQLAVVSAICIKLRSVMLSFKIPYFIVMMSVYCLFCGTLLLANIRRLKNTITEINKSRI
ncbi:MAG TPA: oligosaccharide flippase family protein [Spirochaetia bacterium]|nr:oligosaccharide flippase family protein [Spirochaetia bacterium]